MAKKQASKRHGKVYKKGDGAAAFAAGDAVGPKFFDAKEVAEELGAWWLSGKDKFVIQSSDGRWHEWSQQALIDAMRALPGRLVQIKAREGEQVSEAKQVLLYLRRERALDSLMHALPGYREGLYRLPSNEVVMIKSSPSLITPAAGEWRTIYRIVMGMLGADGSTEEVDQTAYFWSLCKCWESAYRDGTPDIGWKKSHAVIFVGPDGCGKNLLQELILTPLVGGRFANPRKWLMGEDEYNSDIMVEHFALSELPGSQRMEDRTKFAEILKEIIANSELRVRLMRVEPTRFRHFIRISISVNDDPSTMRQLPVVASGFGDKINIFKCRRSILPMVGDGVDEDGEPIEDGDDGAGSERALAAAIQREMPSFIQWLRDDWKIPDALVAFDPGKANPKRFGFRAYHHPAITEQLYEETGAAQVLRLIDMAEFSAGPMDDACKLWEIADERYNCRALPTRNRWWGNAELLQQLLTGDTELVSSVALLAKKLFSHVGCHRELMNLAKTEMDAKGVAGARVFRDPKLTKTSEFRGFWIHPPVS